MAKKEKRVKISLQDMIIKKKEITKKPVIKKIIKKTTLKKKYKNIKSKRTQSKHKKHIVHKKIQLKPHLKPKPKVIHKKDPMSWLYEDKSEQETKQVNVTKNTSSSIAQNIRELYGLKFDTLSTSQQKYILDNQEIMRRITQKVLNRVASVNLTNDININTNNIIEFYLYPNGNMSDFKFLKKTGYFVLDDTTRETIEYAYSQYPRPKEKTLIRYNVFYNLKY